MKSILILSKSLLIMFCLSGILAGSSIAADKPNVILIMTDNHGPWTLGCYGNPEVLTPNIDALANEGTLFTRAFSSNPVCSPTRATFLTGLMPSQHGVHRYLGANGAQIGPQAYNTIQEFKTLPKMLKEAGYTCGLSGKWHLGGNLNPQEGFSYWVTKPHGHTMGFYGQEVIEDGEIRNEKKYLTDLWTEGGVEFIEQNKDKPFFLYLAYNGPYGLGGAMLKPIGNRHAAYYEARGMESFPRSEPRPWLKSQLGLINNPAAMRKYAAEVSGIDDGVGTIMATLKKHGLDENTLVIFTADQGCAGGHGGLWGMGDHTDPLTAYDPTMWIPMIFRQPGRVKAGARSDLMVSNYDLLPTLEGYLGFKGKERAEVERGLVSPGRDFSPVLSGKQIPWKNEIYYEFENVRAMRTEQWKYIERIHEKPNELYDLQNDPEERVNLFGAARVAATQAELGGKLDSFFKKHVDKRWDLWNGGGSKSGLKKGALFGSPKPHRPVGATAN